MSDTARVLLALLVLAALAFLVFVFFQAANDCIAQGGVVVRGIIGIQCIHTEGNPS